MADRRQGFALLEDWEKHHLYGIRNYIVEPEIIMVTARYPLHIKGIENPRILLCSNNITMHFFMYRYQTAPMWL